MNLDFDPQYPPLKWVLKIKGSKHEELKGFCLVEGWKCVQEASLVSEVILILHEVRVEAKVSELGISAPSYMIPTKDLERCCSTMSPEGVLAVVRRPEVYEGAPVPSSTGLHLGLYQWRDPSNVGALVRSARGLGVDSVTMIGTGPDFFSAKVIRSSMGSVFYAKLHWMEDNPELIQGHELFLASAGGASSRGLLRQLRSAFLVIGSESHGLPPHWLSSGRVIGMELKGGLESLSAPVAGALMADHLLHGLPWGALHQNPYRHHSLSNEAT